MKVESRSGDPLGTVSTLYELPQGVMLDVTTGKGSVLIPYRPEIIVRTDVDARVLVLDESLGFQDPQ
jgi:ribosomal 30S subunit maturation factor RimM